ncbi:uncharacterized protein LOC122388744 [Amphibalanus amphitrite]|uniref:uncharacterized protein LOC122388743 n=1 Tax=Amphibalanus amphitrite TaxID=1232801 RepID=UPI001C915915|nr:uncharacterized protein LOC122388743 [Amphibalanus amphitrite]XP_043236058.1 uncharacterized protein LOC122388744 [Amphibalanus amphitrite]
MAYSVPTGEAPAAPPVLDIAVLCDERGRLRWVPELILGVDLRSLEDPEFRAILARRVRRLQIQVHPDRHSGDGTLSRIVNICATVLRDHGAEYARWAAKQDGPASMEVLRAALLLPPPFRDLPEPARTRLADRADELGASLLSAETAIKAERRRAREAKGEALAARLDAADAEAALRAAERRAGAEIDLLQARIVELEARIDTKEAVVCRRIAELEAALDSAEAGTGRARAQVSGLEARVTQLTAELAACRGIIPEPVRWCLSAVADGRPLTHNLRRTARKVLNKSAD